MYDYVDGKVDWMAYGLPVEGRDGPFIGGLVADVPTCGIDATVGDARRLLDGTAPDAAVVVLAGEGLAVGEVDADTLDGHAEGEALLDVMSPVPSTYRPSVTVPAIAEEGGGRQLVSTPDGRLLGAVTVNAGEEHDHDHDHDPALRSGQHLSSADHRDAAGRKVVEGRQWNLVRRCPDDLRVPMATL